VIGIHDSKKERYFTVQTVAERLSCTDVFVYTLIREGKLKAIKIGCRALRISESSCDAFIMSRTVNPADYFAAEEVKPARPKYASTAPEDPIEPARSKWMSK